MDRPPENQTGTTAVADRRNARDLRDADFAAYLAARQPSLLGRHFGNGRIEKVEVGQLRRQLGGGWQAAERIARRDSRQCDRVVGQCR